MSELFRRYPDPDAILAMEPSELGLVLIALHKESLSRGDSQYISLHAFILDIKFADSSRGVECFPRNTWQFLKVALAEAFAWLQINLLIVQSPDQSASSYQLSRIGSSITTKSDVERVGLAARVPKICLNPRLRTLVWSSFVRGEFEVCVFQAMKCVEVRVREAAGLHDQYIGVSLMRKAFDKEKGQLADQSASEAEREAIAHLFSGAIGAYKNPHSHRNVPLIDPQEAHEILLLANHLLNIVDARSRESKA